MLVEAVREARGLISLAALRLDCSPDLIHAAVAREPSVARAVREARELLKDVAEENLVKLIEQGELGAIKYYLSTQAKDRGYIERQEHQHAGPDGGPLVLTVRVVDDRQP